MFTIDGYNYEFRVKEINAIRTLAYKTRFVDVNDVDEATKFFDEVLEAIEVKAGDNWITCNDNGIYYPAGLDKDSYLTESLVNYFMKEFIKPVFPKSNELKDE